MNVQKYACIASCLILKDLQFRIDIALAGNYLLIKF